MICRAPRLLHHHPLQASILLPRSRVASVLGTVGSSGHAERKQARNHASSPIWLHAKHIVRPEHVRSVECSRGVSKQAMPQTQHKPGAVHETSHRVRHLSLAEASSRGSEVPILLDELTDADAAVWCGKFDTWVFDCDGVLWTGKTAIPGAVSALDALRRAGKKIFLVTNNSTKSPAQFLHKLTELGFEG
jgi:hypothetical protein